MKSSMKKYLILLAVVALVVVTAVLTVSAADGVVTPYCTNSSCNFNKESYIDINDPLTYVEAGCETPGYTRVKCTLCNNFMGIFINEVSPTGHDYQEKYLPVDDKPYYEKIEKCNNCGNEKRPEPGAKYYKVTFYNPFATAGKDSYDRTCVYADIIDTTKANAYTTKELAVKYVKEGEAVSYTGVCVREDDKIFSDYTLLGWVSENADGLMLNGQLNKDVIDARKISQVNYETNEYITPEAHAKVFGDTATNKAPIYIVDTKTNSSKEFTLPLEGESEKRDYVVYAIFAGVRETHKVQFKNYAGAVVKTVDVIHGFSASYGYAAPIKPDDHQVYYTFNGNWTYFDGEFSHVVDLSNVYKSITVSPGFDMHSKTYKFQYYDKDGKAYLNAKGEALSDIVAVAGPDKEKYTPVNGRALDVKSYYDHANLYTYTGLWKMSNRLGSTTINIYDVTLPTNVLSYEETDGYIALTPSYYVSTRYYSIPIEVFYPDDNNNHPEEITIQIVSAEGVTKKVVLDGDDIINKAAVQSGREAPIYHCVVQGMKYSELYQISATSRTYHGVADRVVFLVGDTMEEDRYSDVSIKLEHLKQKDCNCLCHSVLKPIWVAALNLMNTLFKIEYVCCDDMFANIGDQLNYGK